MAAMNVHQAKDGYPRRYHVRLHTPTALPSFTDQRWHPHGRDDCWLNIFPHQ